jgi:hypothetical protein
MFVHVREDLDASRFDGRVFVGPHLSTTCMAYSLNRITTELSLHGTAKVAGDIALRTVNRAFFLRVLRCMKLDSVNPAFLAPISNYQGRFITRAELDQFADRREWELSRDFLDEAFGKGDQCYGFFRDGVLAAYQWYATTPTQTGWRGLVASFNRDYVYMYKGFTHPEHRGRRLYPAGVTAAFNHYLSKGYKGILSIVESNNFASLNSCYRMGYADFGKVRVVGIFDRCVLRADASCSAYDLRLAMPQSGTPHYSSRTHPLPNQHTD